MPRTTHNAAQSIDYIETIAAIGEPFNSPLLDTYPEYLTTPENNKTKTFLGVLNLIGQTGCKFLYDKVVNYIDDVSNIDTCKLDALLSTAQTLCVPYKDKKSLETLKTFVKTEDILQLAVWAMSLNVRNTKHVIDRLDLISEDISDLNTRAALLDKNGAIASAIKELIYNIVTKTHISPPSGIDTNMLLQYPWNFVPLLSDIINTNSIIYQKFFPVAGTNTTTRRFNFGKYSLTNHEHTCVKLLRLKNDSAWINLSNDLIKRDLPFLFNEDIFDPIAAAEAVLYNNIALSKYTTTQQAEIAECITAINTTGQHVLDSYSASTLSDIKWLNKLNTHIYADERLLHNVIDNIKQTFGIDPTTYMSIGDNLITDVNNELAPHVLNWWTNNVETTSQFDILSTVTVDTTQASTTNLLFNVDEYVNDVYDELLKFANNLAIIREDLKLLTLRNSLKGTAAIIQLATAEYLNEHLPDIVDNTIDDIFIEQYGSDVATALKDTVTLTTIYNDAVLDPYDVTVIEYWDTTEYYGRTKEDPTDMYPADWNMPVWEPYGDISTINNELGKRDSSNIVRFYVNTLGLSKNTFKTTLTGLGSEADIDISTDAGMTIATNKLRSFLTTVYNAGIFNKALPGDLEKVFSGNPTNAILRQFYTNFKTYEHTTKIDRISKQIHPYIWNFTSNASSLEAITTPGIIGSSPADDGGSVTTIQQDTDILLLNELISDAGNILDQWKLNLSRFIDDSNYWTRYEAYAHTDEEKLICYDGFVYPPFAKALSTITASDDILGTIVDSVNNYNLYDLWYVQYGKQAFNADQKAKENKILANQLELIKASVDPANFIDVDISARTALQNYTVDKDGTAYGVDVDISGNAVLYYKEASYPFMRPLRYSEVDEQLGVTFIDLKGTELTSYANIDFRYNANKNHFPNVVASENAEYLLIRLTDNTVGYFAVTTRVTTKGYVEKALQLKYLIDFTNLLNDNTLEDLCTHITESGVKTLKNDIALLLTDIVDNTFVEYLLILSPNSCKLSKQIIKCSNQVDTVNKFTAGLTLVEDQRQSTLRVIVTTFGLTSDVSNYDTINGFRRDTYQAYLKTPVENTADPTSSFDICNQFVHMMANSNANDNSYTLLSREIFEPIFDVDNINVKTYQLPAEPVKTITFDFNSTGFDNPSLYFSNTMPFARRFNLNSDAGFNPCYLGDSGKLILPDRTSQADLAKTAGIAIELLGPMTNYDDIDADTETLYQNEYTVRIHETDYTAVTETKSEDTDPSSCYSVIKSAANYSVYVDDPTQPIIKKVPRLFTCKLDGLCTKLTATTADESLDVYTASTYETPYVMNNATFAFNVDDAIDTNTKIGVAYLMYKTGDTIWIPTAIDADAKLDDDDFGKDLFDIIFKGDTTKICTRIYRIQQTNGQFGSPYIFDTIDVRRTGPNNVVVKLSGSIPELINIEIVIVGVVADKYLTGTTVKTPNPTFMLTGAEYNAAFSSTAETIRTNDTSFHVRVNHGYGDYYGNKYLESANSINPDPPYYITYESDISDISTSTYTIDAPALANGSLTMSILEHDSVTLGEIMPNQTDAFSDNGKTVLCELLNEMFRIQRLNDVSITNIDDVYNFNYFQFEYLQLVPFDNIETVGDTMYYVQLASSSANMSELDYLKHLTYSAWRVSEKLPATTTISTYVENTLPTNIKITEKDTSFSPATSRPVYINANVENAVENLNIIPKLGIRWKTIGSGDTESIELRFDNATLADSIFVNENNGLIYTSLANAPRSMQLTTSDGPEYLSIVSPIHIIAGSTVFTDIPLATILLSNISDDKPKFMLTVKSNAQDAINGDAYALVFDTASMPEIENLNSITTHCFVAKLDSLRQIDIPQIDTAVPLKQLTFNMNISNILNTNIHDTVDARDNLAIVQIASIYGKTPTHIVENLKQAVAIRNDNNETIKISLKADIDADSTEDEKSANCFSVVDFFVHFHNVTEYSLKNALINAKTTDCIAIDQNGNKLYIAKVFGCDFNNIGPKHVLGTYYGDDSSYVNLTVNQKHWLIPNNYAEPKIPIETRINDKLVEPNTDSEKPDNVVIGTQANTSRQTAILVNLQ